MENKLYLNNETHEIIGAAFDVSHELGSGFLESVYQEAMAKEFNLRKIPFKKEAKLNIFYKGEKLQQYFKADFVCYDSVIVELKTVSKIIPEHQAQLINYLRCLNKKVGLIINFGNSRLEYKRFVL